MTDIFPLRAYGKAELAQLYFPDADPVVAANRLRRQIERAYGLLQALEPTGYPSRAHFFTPRQVAIIVRFLGEPLV